MKNRFYDVVKYTTMIAIPALSTAYVGMDAALNDALPYENEVAKAAIVVTTLLGALVGIQANRYNNSEDRFDGELDINENDTSIIHQLNMDKTTPSELAEKDSITLKVNRLPILLPPPE